MIAFTLLLLAADSTVGIKKPGAIEAAEICTSTVKPEAFDLTALSAAGWLESPIANIEKAPGGTSAHRLFTRDGAGAVIILKLVPEKKGHYCHVITTGSNAYVNSLETALQPSLGKMMKLGGALTFYQTDKPFIASLTRKLNGKDILADVMVMAFTPKAKTQ